MKSRMEEKVIANNLGKISVMIEDKGTKVPVIFMHGVFLEKTLWRDYSTELTKRTHIYIDMPAHGKSSDVGHDWDLNDCVDMLIEIMKELKVDRCFLIGHSWGSMTALRAAVRFPDRFEALGLFNMPFRRISGLSRIGFILQKMMVFFPRFYAKQAAKSLYTKEFLRKRPELITQMQNRLSERPPKEIARAINAVLLKPEDATQLINNLRVPALAVIGESDYVGSPPKVKVLTVPGGHISPHEAKEETREAIKRIIGLASSIPNHYTQ